MTVHETQQPPRGQRSCAATCLNICHEAESVQNFSVATNRSLGYLVLNLKASLAQANRYACSFLLPRKPKLLFRLLSPAVASCTITIQPRQLPIMCSTSMLLHEPPEIGRKLHRNVSIVLQHPNCCSYTDCCSKHLHPSVASGCCAGRLRRRR